MGLGFFVILLRLGEKGGRRVGVSGMALWRDADGPSQFGVPVPPLPVLSRDAAMGTAPSLAPRPGFARACASMCGSFAAQRGVDTAVVQSGM